MNNTLQFQQIHIEVARNARETFMDSGADEYAWWVVRRVGARLANFIADSKNPGNR